MFKKGKCLTDLSRKVTNSNIHNNMVFPKSIENGLEQGSSPPFHHMRTQEKIIYLKPKAILHQSPNLLAV